MDVVICPFLLFLGCIPISDLTTIRRIELDVIPQVPLQSVELWHIAESEHGEVDTFQRHHFDQIPVEKCKNELRRTFESRYNHANALHATQLQSSVFVCRTRKDHVWVLFVEVKDVIVKDWLCLVSNLLAGLKKLTADPLTFTPFLVGAWKPRWGDVQMYMAMWCKRKLVDFESQL